MKEINIDEKKLKSLKVIDKSDNQEIKSNLFSLPWRIVLVSRSGGGKSSRLTNLLCNKNYGYDKLIQPENTYIFCPNILGDEKLMHIQKYHDIPDNNIYTDSEKLDEDDLDHVYTGLKDEYMQDNDRRGMIIIDDYSSTQVFAKRNNVLSKIYSNCRKFQISVITLAQYYFDLNPSIRMNANIILIGQTSNKNLEQLAREHNYLLGNDADFKKMFRSNVKEVFDFFCINYTNKYDCLYLDSDYKPITHI